MPGVPPSFNSLNTRRTESAIKQMTQKYAKGRTAVSIDRVNS